MTQPIVRQPKLITLADIASQAERSVAMMEQIRTAMLSPSTRKSPPTFSLSQLADILEIEKG